jgi:ABC-type amino acid transport system permease subunit
MAYEWSLIPYPTFRAFNLFNAFVLTAISVGFITAFSIESQAFFVQKEENKYNFEKLERENNAAGVHYHPGKNIFKVSNNQDPYDYNNALHRALRVSLVSACISFIVYILMYTIFGFGGGMVSIKRKFRLFSSIPA